MCGFWILISKKGCESKNPISFGDMYESFYQISNRGPDRSSFVKLANGLHVGFCRLSIMDLSTRGDQPFVIESDDGDSVIYAVCNGEIYYFKELCRKYGIECQSGSDCEVLPHLFKKISIDAMIAELNGEFAFAIIEINRVTGEIKLNVGRDHAGIRPLFVTQSDTEMVITSELKGSPFLDLDYPVEQFKPRHFATISNLDLKLEYKEYVDFGKIIPTVTDLPHALEMVKNTLEECVKCRLDSDAPIGFLLSGGLDSSLLVAIAARILKAMGKEIYTFSIGLENSPDEYFAKKVSEWTGSIHQHIVLPEEYWFNAITDVIKIIESYDVTTVRASTGQYLISKWIRENTNIKVLIIGDGSDEIANGYMYNHKCPSHAEAHEDSVRLVNNIHFFDVLRADRGIASNGLEARVPFLDKRFIQTYFSIDPSLRVPIDGMEKWLMRKAFDGTGYLPTEVLWRRKTAFSDGCSSRKKSWYEVIQERIESLWTQEEFEQIANTYTHCKPLSKEALYFRLEFEKIFGTGQNTQRVIPYYWLPMWCGNVTDPSARTLAHYQEDAVPEHYVAVSV